MRVIDFPKLGAWRKWLMVLFALMIGVAVQAGTQTARAVPVLPPQPTNPSVLAPSAPSTVYLPFIRGGVPPIIAILIGVYGPIGSYWGTQQDVNQYLIGLDSWAGLSRTANKGHSIGADYKGIDDPNPAYNVPTILETLWDSGYTGFINIGSTYNNIGASAIANGAHDAQIDAWATAYLGWVNQGQNRRAFLALLPEMNGSWTSYGCTPTDFKAAYNRIKTRFEAKGVTSSKVWWVFAPNGWSSPCAPMSAYYPGDSVVDVVAFSSYNQSHATAWMNPQEVFGPYIDIIRVVAPTKPIFIAQTGSCSAKGDKDQWLRDAYSYLLQRGIRAILYYNGDKECDWAVYQPSGRKLQGYKDAVTAPNATRYIAPATLAGTVLPP